MPKVVALDLDNTLNNLSLEYIKYAKEILGYNMIPENNKRHFKHYELGKHFPKNTPQQEIEKAYETIFSDYNFWINMKVKYGSYDLVSFFQKDKRYTLRIVTYPWHFVQGSVDGKKDWLKKNFPQLQEDQIIFQKYKWEGNYDVIIDDNVDILNNCFEKGIHTIRMFHFYNIKAKCHRSFRTLSQIRKYMDEEYE